MLADEVKTIAVIGLGTMGPGIAQAFAQAGYYVTGYDVNPRAAETCKKVISGIVEILKEFGRISPSEERASLDNIAYAGSLGQAVQDAHIIIEAIPENRDAKRELYRQIDDSAPEGSLLWSNTSTLNIFDLVPPHRLGHAIIAHWFAPPHIIPLVEVVRESGVSSETVQTTVDILKKLRKVPIVLKKYLPGFVINRIQRLLGREIFFLLDNGYIGAEALDLAVKASIAPRMMVLGLVQRYDFTGLDLSASNLADESFFDPPIDNHPNALHSKIKKGDLGVKTGRGFYDYSGLDITEILKKRDRHLLKVMDGVQFCLEKGRLV
ncbi:MAG: 3-hydroxyacyl-CoA dehydrogenase family protein [Deltaproteobacteria bacterium]|nr:3-hydroxyacyl-CoA dehydrogenase family protein [Deltaproteobacteria bacterium]MBW1922987.1 3-hydroxyacyl-CoA dehydrogenase family protein [Deltaproteobacteria bacterium]MBW2009389.1 3-hydroxyacyl-CoA dehydrogenase family protein [Deltaproteobacteria bacterium]MBW2346770.1 3-hydroxyacyl-CoA dehydrogenase family protein [Deltaproteobacteria bacterium]RLB37762.1 MAG: 3-hydroxyacyl-CoA dehydrogenase family protein [Deltaproteobacteria bacterium]